MNRDKAKGKEGKGKNRKGEEVIRTESTLRKRSEAS